MMDLPDVNVWLALVDENHVHHQRALAYWYNESLSEVVFCRVTVLGFLRLSTHPSVLSRPLAPDEAWSIYRRYRDEARVGFLEDSPKVDSGFMTLSDRKSFAHHLWTDCYLAALALFRDCRIVSFDKDFDKFPRLKFLHLSK